MAVITALLEKILILFYKSQKFNIGNKQLLKRGWLKCISRNDKENEFHVVATQLRSYSQV
jgi:hypothetical protein